MKIRPYDTQQYSAQGSIQGDRATSDAFGGQIADAEQNLAGAGFKSADILTDIQEAKDQVWRSNTVSSFQLNQMQALQDAKTDPDFAKKYGADGGKFTEVFGESLDQGINQVTSTPGISPKSARKLQLELNNVKENLMTHATVFQAETGGAYVKQQVVDRTQTDAKIVKDAPTEYLSTLQRGVNDIAQLPLLTPEVKHQMIDDYSKSMALATGMGEVLRRPEGVLAAIAPEVLSTFKPTPRVLANTNIPVKGFSAATVAPAVEKYGPVVQQYAAQFSVDPNFMKAQLDQESKGNPAAINVNDINVTGHPSIGIAQFQPGTAARYGIDPTKPEQAIKGQAAYMSDLLKMFGGDYRKAAAGYNWGEGNVTKAVATYGDKWFDHIPASTQNYINEIFKKAQPVPDAATSLAATQEQQTSEPSRAATNPDWFNNLDWKQQFQIINEAEQGVRANQVRDSQTLALQKQQKEAAEQKVMDGMFNRIGAEKDPLSVAEVRQSDLSYQNKEHMLEAINKVTRGEASTDPAKFNDLFQRIHAAPNDPNRISDDKDLLPYVGHGLSITDLNTLRGELRGKNTPDGAATADLKKNFFTMAKGQIDTSTFISNDPIGKQKFYEFQQKVISTIDQKTRAGTPVLELFDPNSKEYLGKLIPLYQRTPAQQMQDYSQFMAGTGATKPAAEPRKPGESPAEYLKRTGTAQ